MRTVEEMKRIVDASEKRLGQLRARLEVDRPEVEAALVRLSAAGVNIKGDLKQIRDNAQSEITKLTGEIDTELTLLEGKANAGRINS